MKIHTSQKVKTTPQGQTVWGGDITDMEIEIMEKQLEIFGEVLEKYNLKI